MMNGGGWHAHGIDYIVAS